MRRFISFIKKFRLSTLEDGLAVIAMVAIMFMMFLTATDVTMRKFFNEPITGSLEILEVVLALIVFFGLARSQRLRVHVGMDLAFDRLKGHARALHGLHFFDLLLPLFIFAIVTYFSWGIAMEAYEKHQLTTGVLRFPEAPFMFTVPLGGFLLCVRFLIQLGNETIGIIKGKREEVPLVPPEKEFETKI
jgi:TRAP-type C4-dicarboxylate transport system permease small subunit